MTRMRRLVRNKGWERVDLTYTDATRETLISARTWCRETFSDDECVIYYGVIGRSTGPKKASFAFRNPAHAVAFLITWGNRESLPS